MVSGGSGEPKREVGVRAGILGGQQFEDLGGEAQARLGTVAAGDEDALIVTDTEYERLFPDFPDPREFLRDDDYYFLEYEDRFYRVNLTEAETGKYRVGLIDLTETVRLEYRTLSGEARDLIARAESRGGSVNVSDLPSDLEGGGVDAGLFGSREYYYLSWEDEYYTVGVSDPVQFVETPSPGSIVGLVGVLAGIVIAVAGVVVSGRDS